MLITTYSMISFAGQRSEIAKKIIDSITKREWGFMLLDEVLRLFRIRARRPSRVTMADVVPIFLWNVNMLCNSCSELPRSIGITAAEWRARFVTGWGTVTKPAYRVNVFLLLSSA